VKAEKYQWCIHSQNTVLTNCSLKGPCQCKLFTRILEIAAFCFALIFQFFLVLSVFLSLFGIYANLNLLIRKNVMQTEAWNINVTLIGHDKHFYFWSKIHRMFAQLLSTHEFSHAGLFETFAGNRLHQKLLLKNVCEKFYFVTIFTCVMLVWFMGILNLFCCSLRRARTKLLLKMLQNEHCCGICLFEIENINKFRGYSIQKCNYELQKHLIRFATFVFFSAFSKLIFNGTFFCRSLSMWWIDVDTKHDHQKLQFIFVYFLSRQFSRCLNVSK